MLEIGEWVEFTRNGKTTRGYVTSPYFNRTTIAVLELGKFKLYSVPSHELVLSSTELLPQDKNMLIDMALASRNQSLFESLTGSLASQL
jgi:hypothetical protein